MCHATLFTEFLEQVFIIISISGRPKLFNFLFKINIKLIFIFDETLPHPYL